jgi:Ni/Co efflux regulator RcnB
MQKLTVRKTHMLALMIAGAFAFNSVHAKKPDWVDDEKSAKQEEKEWRKAHKRPGKQEERVERVRVREYFGDRHRTIVHRYFAQEINSGHCPPGLAKKHNGCMPPGQAKKWAIGRPLPRTVTYYTLPPAIVVELGPPPPGYQYVRVADDILLLSIGTHMVVDAIQNLLGR